MVIRSENVNNTTCTLGSRTNQKDGRRGEDQSESEGLSEGDGVVSLSEGGDGVVSLSEGHFSHTEMSK